MLGRIFDRIIRIIRIRFFGVASAIALANSLSALSYRSGAAR